MSSCCWKFLSFVYQVVTNDEFCKNDQGMNTIFAEFILTVFSKPGSPDWNIGSDHRIGSSDHWIIGSDHRIGPSDHWIGSSDRIIGSDHRIIGSSDHWIKRSRYEYNICRIYTNGILKTWIIGSEHRIGSSDRIIGSDHRIIGSSDRIIGSDHRIIGSDHRIGSLDRIIGSDHQSSDRTIRSDRIIS